MAINKNHPKMDFPLQLQRLYAGPLDKDSVYYDESSAKAYAGNANGVAYAGQLLTVVDESGKQVKVYVVGVDGALQGIKIDDGVLS